MTFPRWKKVAALALAALCSAANFALAVSLYSLWRSSKRDAQQLGESEWGGLANAWVKSVNALGGLAAFYFLTAALANAIGFVGMLKVRKEINVARLGNRLTGLLSRSVLLGSSAYGVTSRSPTSPARRRPWLRRSTLQVDTWISATTFARSCHDTTT